jgi:hypothetical protein
VKLEENAPMNCEWMDAKYSTGYVGVRWMISLLSSDKEPSSDFEALETEPSSNKRGKGSFE